MTLGPFDRLKRLKGARRRVSHSADTDDLDVVKRLVGKTLSFQMRHTGSVLRLEEAEFKVYSQFGEDGIIQYLTHTCGAIDRSFVEFGVGDYTQSNTRFLLQNDNWRGLVIEGEAKGVELIKRDAIYPLHDLTVVNAFITAESINSILEGAGFKGDLGLLSIDIDGNDYWVWKAIEVVKPAIVVVEYNAVFGSERPVSIPYDPTFDWTRAHYSLLYWGASLPALCHLAEQRGYAFVGANRNGVNAFFVRKDRLGPLAALTCREGFVDSRFRLSRDRAGKWDYIAGLARRAVIADCIVEDVTTGERLRVGDL
jgi:hypothetical protein